MKCFPGWLIILFIFFCGFAPQTVHPQTLTDPLRVHFIDVGQGDGILIQTPDGAAALIDSGYDNGLALAYLQQQSIQRLNAVIASHPHADHIGGLIEVMQAIPTDGIWTSGASHTTSYYERFLDTIDRQHIPYFEVGQGETIPLGDLGLNVLHAQRRAGNLNDTSLVLRLQYGQTTFLFTGDAEAPAERQMLQTVPDRLPATVLKVGHHGSYTSSTPSFLSVVQPQYTVVVLLNLAGVLLLL
jgi:competence protein ComEC